jgi:hypothetical protein
MGGVCGTCLELFVTKCVQNSDAIRATLTDHLLVPSFARQKNHYQDLPPVVQRRLGTLPGGFLNYFTSRFPALFTHVHTVVRESRLRQEAMFAPYFEIEE